MWVVMISGPTETPTLMGLYRKQKTAEKAAERWNKANPPDEDDTEPYKALAWPVQPFDCTDS